MSNDVDDFNPDKDKDKQYGSRKYGRVMKKKDDEDDGPHRSQNLTDFYPDDTRLRNHGFVIHARPRTGPTIWLRGATPYTEAEALHIADDLEQAERVNLEDAA